MMIKEQKEGYFELTQYICIDQGLRPMAVHLTSIRPETSIEGGVWPSVKTFQSRAEFRSEIARR